MSYLHKTINAALLFTCIQAFVASATAFGQCEDQRLSDPTMEQVNAFGGSVAIHNGFAVVGAHVGGDGAGRAYVYKRVGDSWMYEATLQGTGAEGHTEFGSMVAIHTDRILVGEFAASPPVEPRVHVFRRSGTTWMKETELTGIQGPDDIVTQISSLAYDGTYAVIGTEEDRTAGFPAGALYVFRRNGTAWILQDQIVLSPAPQSSARLGGSVAIEGDFIVAGATTEQTTSGLESGAVYVFKRNDNGTPANLADDFWAQLQRLTRSDGTAFSKFGNSVSISGDVIAATSKNHPGGVVIFRWNGVLYTQEAIVPVGSENAVAVLNGSELLCGIPDADVMSGPTLVDNAGKVAIVTNSGTSWTVQSYLTPSLPQTSGHFGMALARSGSDIGVGAPGMYDINTATWTGSAYVFNRFGVCSDSACASDPKCRGACCGGDLCTPNVWEPDCDGGLSYQGGFSLCQAESTTATCTDGYDDDCDGDVDCADSGCAAVAACQRACCFSSSSCLNLWTGDCTDLGGVPGGAGSTCATTPCFPTGACCLASGGCQNGVSPTACDSGGGSYLGFASICQGFELACGDGLDNDCDGTADCADSDCSTGPSCAGACCYAVGSCMDGVSEAFCASGNGNYQGNGTGCASVSCPQPQGACCTTSGGCAELVAADCQVVPNSGWSGPLTTCQDSFPPTEHPTTTCCDNYDNDCDGTTDLDDEDCADVVCSTPLQVPPPPHDFTKSRYLSFTAENKQSPYAIKISRVDPAFGEVGWIGAPDSRGLSGLKSAPVVRIWTESAIHVGDCAISPAAMYEVRSTPNGIVFSSPLVLTTTPKPQGKEWGDLVGVLASGSWTPPNGFANIQDITAVLHNIQAQPNAPHVSVVDLQATGTTNPCLNRIVNTADVLLEVRAVSGDSYPFTIDPAACPPCP